MSYVALYRKWRPNEFSEVKGQEHIVTTLKNQIIHDRVGHAYLFCGTRGTGKTTVAKLFAKAVNCESPLSDGSPCNECETCKAISQGSSMNVIEIDAASNNGVDNIREIREQVQYSPASGKYKIYIIDEVHMLSIGAFNALLKTLEEPPSYVIFILATTEAHKIPITILSRCQRYDFRRISLEVIADRLMDLVNREGIAAEEKAVQYIAKVADGSMRDGLSLLDQCIAFYLGQELTYENVLEVLGAVDIEVFNKLMDTIIEKDTVKAVEVIDSVIWQGRDLGQFIIEFTWYMRNLLLVKASEKGTDSLDMSQENIETLKITASKLEIESLIRYIRIFSELSNTIKYATQKRVMLELAIIKLCVPSMESGNIDSISDRVLALEKDIDKKLSEMSSNVQVVQMVNSVETTVTREVPKATKEDINKLISDKTKLIDALKTVPTKMIATNFEGIRQEDIYPTDTGFNIFMLDNFSIKRVDRDVPKKQIIDHLADRFGVEYDISFTQKVAKTTGVNSVVSSINNVIDVTINN